MTINDIAWIIGEKADYYLKHETHTFKSGKDEVVFARPNPEFVEQAFGQSDRSREVVNNLKKLYATGFLANTGYLSILPVDQGIEHSAGSDFAPNPIYFDPENIIKLAIEAECNGVASTLGVLGLHAERYAEKIPFVVKLNHNELLSYPNSYDQTMFASVQQAKNMGAVGVGATIYFGSKESKRQISEVSEAFAKAHELGMFTILWCYLRNPEFKTKENDYHTAADLTGQAIHLGVTIEADIVKQKLPTNNGGFKALSTKESPYGKLDERIYSELSSDHPIDMVRYQVANAYLGKIPLINSGGASGEDDIREAVISAVVNKRGGGSGLIMGRKAFQKPFEEGVEILRKVQEVYRCEEVSVAK